MQFTTPDSPERALQRERWRRQKAAQRARKRLASPPDRNKAPRLCDEDGCHNGHVARGLCRKHYQRVYRQEQARKRGLELAHSATEEAPRGEWWR